MSADSLGSELKMLFNRAFDSSRFNGTRTGVVESSCLPQGVLDSNVSHELAAFAAIQMTSYEFANLLDVFLAEQAEP